MKKLEQKRKRADEHDILNPNGGIVMIYRITEQGTEPIEAKDVQIGCGQYAAVLPFSALKEGLEAWGMQGRQMEEAPMHADARFDTQNGFDSIYLQIPREPDMPAWPQRVCIYLSENVLIFAGQEMDPVSYTHLDVYKRQRSVYRSG